MTPIDAPTVHILILGGTGEGKQLAAKVAELPGVEVVLSLAGRTRGVRPTENLRVGGFGGVMGLADYLQEQQIDAVIDATHPFADRIARNAITAAARVGVPHLMLVRPAWEQKNGDRWIEVESCQGAAAVLPALAERIFLTVGRQNLADFAHLRRGWFLLRMVEPPEGVVLPGKLLLERGPFSLEKERSLLQHYRIQALVSKNSGGAATYAKIIAARELGVPVVMVQRPPLPTGERVATVERAIAWLRDRFSLPFQEES